VVNMAKAIYVQKGEINDFANTTAAEIEYNDVVPLAHRIGIAKEIIPVGAVGSLAVTGVYELPADTTAAFTNGETLYWDAANAKVVKTSGDIVAGWAFADKVTAGTTALVKIGIS
jgi:predicted RecA/RadA family phage recombinase